MKIYYARVPESAVHPYFDGHSYAYVNVRMHFELNGKITVQDSSPRLMRADGCRVENGEAYILIGRAGDAIADTTNLPFSVNVVHEVLSCQ